MKFPSIISRPYIGSGTNYIQLEYSEPVSYSWAHRRRDGLVRCVAGRVDLVRHIVVIAATLFCLLAYLGIVISGVIYLGHYFPRIVHAIGFAIGLSVVALPLLTHSYFNEITSRWHFFDWQLWRGLIRKSRRLLRVFRAS